MKTYSDRKKSMLLKNVIFLVKSHSLIPNNSKAVFHENAKSFSENPKVDTVD